MDAFIDAIRATAISEYFRNQAQWLWPLCESLHFLGLSLLIGTAGFFDLRLLGFMRGVSLGSAKRFIPWATAGFLVNAITGVVFFVS